MEEIAPSGFRVRLNIVERNEMRRQCYVFLNLKKMKLIKDVEEHIKSILDLNRVSLLVDDAWLPSNEVVYVIKGGDTITVETTCSDSLPQTEGPILKKKRKKRDDDDYFESDIISVEHLHNELNNKKNELLHKIDTFPSQNSNVTTTFSTEAEGENVQLSPRIVKRKRVRKHKKKSNITNPCIPEIKVTSPDNDYAAPEMNVPYSGKHLRFFNEEQNNGTESLGGNINSTDADFEATDSAVGSIQNQEEVNSTKISVEINESVPAAVCPENQIEPQQCAANRESKNPMIVNTQDNNQNESMEENTEEKSLNGNEEVDWSWKLLGMALQKDLPSKIFYRKLASNNRDHLDAKSKTDDV